MVHYRGIAESSNRQLLGSTTSRLVHSSTASVGGGDQGLFQGRPTSDTARPPSTSDRRIGRRYNPSTHKTLAGHRQCLAYVQTFNHIAVSAVADDPPPRSHEDRYCHFTYDRENWGESKRVTGDFPPRWRATANSEPVAFDLTILFSNSLVRSTCSEWSSRKMSNTDSS